MRIPAPLLFVVCCFNPRDVYEDEQFVDQERFDAALNDQGELSEDACFDLCGLENRLHDPERISCVITDAEATQLEYGRDTGPDTDQDTGFLVAVDGVALECSARGRLILAC